MTDTARDTIGCLLMGSYRAATGLATLVLPFHLRRRVRQGKEDEARLGERWGRYETQRPSGRLLWIHAASVGESLSILPLIDALREGRAPFSVLVTTGTVTSARLMAQRLPERCRHVYAPLDVPKAVSAFLSHWQPDLAILVESELWPNLIIKTKAVGCPMILLNGRMSKKSHRGWSRLRPLARRILGCFALVLAQSDLDAERFRDLGSENCRHLGNLKFAAAPLACDDAELQRLRGALKGRPLWLAASTHPGEERLITQSHRILRQEFPQLLTLLVPRHPERGPDLAEELGAEGLGVVRRAAGGNPAQAEDIYLADSIGELGLWYRLCEIVFVGGSLVPKGGQNLLEPAKLDAALISGPHLDNFRTIAAGLRQAGALEVVEDAAALAAKVSLFLREENRRSAAADAAARFAAGESQVLQRILEALERYLADFKTAKSGD